MKISCAASSNMSDRFRFVSGQTVGQADSLHCAGSVWSDSHRVARRTWQEALEPTMPVASPGRPAMYASQSLNSSVSQKRHAVDRNSMHLGRPIDLNSPDISRDRQTGEPVTKRAFHIDVVLEGTRKDHVGQGMFTPAVREFLPLLIHLISQATRELLAQLGKPLSYSTFISEATAGTAAAKGCSSSAPGTPSKAMQAGKQDPIKLGKVFNELKETEQGYLRRISYLKTVSFSICWSVKGTSVDDSSCC